MDEEEYLPLSWLSQATYCLRRAALLLNERLWMENADTAKGRDEHRRAHERRIERRGDQLKLFEYDVYSEQLRIWGKCDCVEAQRCEPGCRIPAADFPVCLYPVEYKHGSVREEPEYNILDKLAKAKGRNHCASVFAGENPNWVDPLCTSDAVCPRASGRFGPLSVLCMEVMNGAARGHL